MTCLQLLKTSLKANKKYLENDSRFIAAKNLVTKKYLEDDVYLWMIDNQNGRRNLTDGWKYKLQQRKKEILLNKGKEEKSKAGGDKKSGLQISAKPIINKVDTRKELSKTLNWSTGKVAMADIVFKKASIF